MHSSFTARAHSQFGVKNRRRLLRGEFLEERAMLATTDLVSVGMSGAANSASFSTKLAISADGRFVAFQSLANDLVAGDSNGVSDIFVRDMQSGETTRVSISSAGAQANASSSDASISADGRFVSFASDANNLVSGDTNGARDVFVHDRQTGETTRVNVTSAGAQSTGGNSLRSALSADGRFVAFESNATNLVAGDTNATTDVFLHDRNTGATTRVSVSGGGTQGNFPSDQPAISGDGRYIAFVSVANNLVDGDTANQADIFVHDTSDNSTTRVSVNNLGEQGNLASLSPTISTDGRYVAFRSGAHNLVAGDENGFDDIFVHDRNTGSVERVSVNSGGIEGNNFSSDPAISGNGRYVAFASDSTNLVDGDANGFKDIFLHDRDTNTTTLLSVSSEGTASNALAMGAAINANGRHTVFQTVASTLVDGDTNGVSDVFRTADFSNNSPPSDLAISDADVAENLPIGTVVGTLSATDPDVSEIFTFALVTGAGSADNASFTIDGDQLKTAASFDFETKDEYSIRVRVTDAGGEQFEKSFVISITDAADPAPLSVVDDVFVVSSSTTSAAFGAVGLLTNDEIPAGAVSIEIVTQGAFGSAMLTNDSGAFTYTKATNFAGVDEFTYRVTVGAESDEATVRILSHEARQVTKLYEQVLGRGPDDGGLRFWTAQVLAGAPLGNVASGIFESAERLDPIIAQMYIDYLFRTADAGGLAYWRGVWQADGGPENVVAGIISSDEFFTSPEVDSVNMNFVDEVYERLLGREPDAGGIAYWTNLLDSGLLTRAGMILEFELSNENFRNRVAGWFMQYLGRSATESEIDFYVDQLELGASQRDIQIQLINTTEYRNTPPPPPAGEIVRLVT